VRTALVTAAACATVAAGLGLVATAPAAAADCSSPFLHYPAGEVDRGDVVTVVGESFGDDCHDTGPPPPGEGPLGRPLAGVEVVVTQDGVDTVLATPQVDERYAFAAEVTIPATLVPGDARLHARWPATEWTSGRTDVAGAGRLVVTDAPPPAAPGTDEAAATRADGDGDGDGGSDRDGARSPWAGRAAGAAGAAAGLVALAVLATRARRARARARRP
jgi:hypothetical protein